MTRTVVRILLVAFAASFLLADGQAMAQTRARPRLPAVTGNIAKDIRTDLGISDNAGVKKNADGSIVCDFNIFLVLNPKNLQQVIKACVSDASSTLADDTSTALASAQAFTDGGDQTAIQCLKPALAIIQAGMAKPAVAAAAATATTPAVAAEPAYSPGAITLFQKFREFVLAGGPTACQNWVNGTVSGAIAPAAGVVGTAAAAVISGGVIP